KKSLGYVPEEPNLYPYLTGREYLQLVGRLRCLPAAPLESRIDQLLNLLSLHEHRYSPISSYSKGMKQKILISAALLHNPDVLVFDEPLSGLDVTTSLVFKNLIKALVRKGCVVANDSVAHLRDLLALPSLEDVFSQLVQQEDTEKIAEDIMDVMQA